MPQASMILAVTRPVFRGLRPGRFRPAPRAILVHSCSDETRFQGIATNSPGLDDAGIRHPACSDETRFQGIATCCDVVGFRGRVGGLAVTRPVFRGLRRPRGAILGGKLASRLAVTRPVFRGLRLFQIPEPRLGPEARSQLAVTRPVFRGLRRSFILINGSPWNLSPSCSDETRFQGIATSRNTFPPELHLDLLLAVTRPVFRGLRHVFAGVRIPRGVYRVLQ